MKQQEIILLFRNVTSSLLSIFKKYDNFAGNYGNVWWKAVIVLLALLYLGVKNIHLGPTLPAFLSPNVANVLVQNFGIAGITNVEDDIKALIY